MLRLPDTGFQRSVNKHNVDLDILCDWIEASILFDDDVLSKSDVVDVLKENQIYDSQDFALEIVDQAWSAVTNRIAPFAPALNLTIGASRIERREPWTAFPAYGFCLAISCAPLYDVLRHDHPPVYATQGNLFEEVAHLSLKSILHGWDVRRIGWAPDNPVRLREIIHDTIAAIREVAGSELDSVVNGDTNDMGLDLLCHFPFNDAHASLPILMLQCASGVDWIKKRKTPDLELWKTAISFNSQPVRGMVIPYAFATARDLRREMAHAKGILIERYRLLVAFQQGAAVTDVADLNARLTAWINTRLPHVPLGDT